MEEKVVDLWWEEQFCRQPDLCVETADGKVTKYEGAHLVGTSTNYLGDVQGDVLVVRSVDPTLLEEPIEHRDPWNTREIYSFPQFTREWWQKWGGFHPPGYIPDGLAPVFLAELQQQFGFSSSDYGSLSITDFEVDKDGTMNVHGSFTPVQPAEWVEFQITLDGEDVVP